MGKNKNKSREATPVDETIPDLELPPVELKKKKEPDIPVEVLTAKPLVSVQVFSQVCGVKPDQLAGFNYYVKRKKLGPFTIEDWKKQFQTFKDRPMG